MNNIQILLHIKFEAKIEKKIIYVAILIIDSHLN